MLSGDVNLPEVTFTPDDAVVNQLFNMLCIESDANFTKRFVHTVKQFQNYLYVKLQGQLLCPDCAGGILMAAKRPEMAFKAGVVYAVMVEVYAVLGLLVTMFMLLFGIAWPIAFPSSDPMTSAIFPASILAGAEPSSAKMA